MARWRAAAAALVLGCLAASGPEAAEDAGAAPAWAGQAPPARRAGGKSGASCWATPLPDGREAMPEHCARSAAAGRRSPERDWWVGPAQEPAPRSLGEAQRPERSRSAGEQAWIARGGSWSRVRIVSAGGSAYWILALDGGRFCPGDSGAPLWAGERGAPKWIGMLVSGEGPGCSAMASAVKSQAIPWQP